ncbi:hypothetical protein CEN45_09505 [Fischerella thermalis CCMEE 5198]|jgi:hypothetical protein|uniref:hypothetical protein n=1 Tax=Fischerella thermalis TaxID=372787 RepID=UPI000C80D2D1|nr:hypothetical protein [Fischerella thermalis]PMB07219.1 hypothetical protein CI594_00795 [Fischerella thermalis CCMEE 5196]PMB23813.1 hypothetical protein CEN45_09505 [Fischerella thermalis CCMEE 5198]PMB51779.1 hypothetical protein CEN39_13450 [Fischerella thermalis CCMEE 5201]
MAEREDKNNYRNPSQDVFKGLWEAKVVIAIAFIAVFVRLSYTNEQPTTVPTAQLVTTSEVANYPDELIGKTVTVRSRPLQRVGLSSFTVSDRRFFGGEPILVVNASGRPFDLPSDRENIIQVTGEVRNLAIPQIERQYNLSLQDQYYRDYINKPVIIARDIRLAPDSTAITLR